MQDRNVVSAVLLDDGELTVREFAVACSTSVEWVSRHVEEGAIDCLGNARDDWRFSRRHIARARRMLAVERDFDAVPELAALVADMLDEIDELRARLRRAGLA